MVAWMKLTKNENSTSKILIINEDSQSPFLIDLIQNEANSSSIKLFKYSKLKKSNKTINLFETSEVYIYNIYFFKIIIIYDFKVLI